MFSVVLPLYNKEKSISRTINSVLNQSFREFELLIINDGSTDNSEFEVKKFDDTRIRIINKENGGVSSARNTGIKESKFDYIAFIDGDDLWHIDFLSQIKSLIKKWKKAKVYATGFAKVNLVGEILKENTVTGEGLIEDYFSKVLEVKHSILHSSAVCIKKELFDMCGNFKENLTHGEDLDMWERLSKITYIAITPAIFSYYMQESENRAMAIFPKLERTRVYNINIRNLTSDQEKKYYKAAVLSAIKRSLINKRFIRALRIYLKYIGFIGIP